MWSGLTEVLLRATPKMDLVVLLSGYTPSLRQRVLYLDVNRLRDPCGGARVNRPWVDSSPCTPYKNWAEITYHMQSESNAKNS